MCKTISRVSQNVQNNFLGVTKCSTLIWGCLIMLEFIWTLFDNVQIGIGAKCANNHKVSIPAKSKPRADAGGED